MRCATLLFAADYAAASLFSAAASFFAAAAAAYDAAAAAAAIFFRHCRYQAYRYLLRRYFRPCCHAIDAAERRLISLIAAAFFTIDFLIVIIDAASCHSMPLMISITASADADFVFRYFRH